jgi:hypothetical protein
MTFFAFFNPHALGFHESALSCDEWKVGFFE